MSAWVSSVLAVACGIGGWVGLGSVELGANESLVGVTTALVSVEETLRGSARTAEATADALDAAAVSLEAADATSAASGEVARDMASVTATLAPVAVSVADGLRQIDRSIDDINAVLSAVPLPLGTIRGIDDALTDIEPLLVDLAAAEASLEALADQADELGPTTVQLAGELRTVAAELRSSITDIETLADDLGDTNRALSAAGTGEPVDLLLAKLVVAGFALAIVASNWDVLREARRAGRSTRPELPTGEYPGDRPGDDRTEPESDQVDRGRGFPA
jgi:hypothetical protein